MSCVGKVVTRVGDSNDQETQESPGLGHEKSVLAVYDARWAS